MTTVRPHSFRWKAASCARHRLGLEILVVAVNRIDYRLLSPTEGGIFQKFIPEIMKISVFEKLFEILAVDGPLSSGNNLFSHETATLQ